MIKPSDIPDELESMCQGIEWFQCGDLDKPAVAAILNAAIEAGIVSPPCYCVRWDGELQMRDRTNPVTGLIDPKVYIGKPFSHDTEHYRGQTE